MKSSSHSIKKTLKLFKEQLGQEFSNKTSIVQITRRLVQYIDQLLMTLFDKHQLDQDDHFCLLAVGGYGRKALQLHSDVDLILLHVEGVSEAQISAAQAFIQDCWDSGLAISHQLTTTDTCSELALTDLSVISTLLDSRLLCGCAALMEELSYKIHPLHMWPSIHYYYAKKEEQNQRYAKYDETAYMLEPNVKYGPGGLRDLHILLSIAKRHFSIKKLSEGIVCQFISEKEYEELIHCQHFLWRIRFALHYFAGKQEERLLFDYQQKLAGFFGFVDDNKNLAVEKLMKKYFTVIKRSRELNEMLLQCFEEMIVHHQRQQLRALDHCFQLSNQFIEVKHALVFKQDPTTLIGLFLWIAREPLITGVRASTIRLIRNHLYLIGKNFRESPAVIVLFRAIFQENNNPYLALQYMNKYGVLSRYLHCFSAITGQMQYDLFHSYTVDQHTLFVIRNLVRFLQAYQPAQFAYSIALMEKIEKREILYLAALFHDIGKGRGGDHSEIGAHEAHLFALKHQLSPQDRELLTWLVAHHLLMSQTAQRQDIYDPKIIDQFCCKIPHPEYLDYLYLLTVADICATNFKLWNSWKDSLLKELHRSATLALQEQQNEESVIQARQQQALSLLAQKKISPQQVKALWDHFKCKYFLHESAESIAYQTEAILNNTQPLLILILPHHTQGGTEIFIYMPHREQRFMITTTVLSNQQITIQEAMILTCDNQFDLDTYVVLDEQQGMLNEHRIQVLQKSLTVALLDTQGYPAIVKRRLSRRQAHFQFKPTFVFDEEPELSCSRLFLMAGDSPGLLAKISKVFSQQGLFLHNAKIATSGERAEDTFYISNQKGLPLSSTEQKRLQDDLLLECF